MRKFLLLMMGLCVMSVQLFAQNRTVTGKVTDQTGNAIPNVSVIVKGTTIGTITKEDGTFSLSIPSTARTLVFTATGMTAVEQNIGDRTSFNIQMRVAESSMEEVVVVGYQTLTKKEVTGAISKVTAASIENMPVQSLDRALQGQAAGVSVISNSGLPGGAVTVRIRGTGSISAGNTPLYVVDGIPMNTDFLTTNITQTNPLAFLNPNDIESIEVLKDAAAASIYGAAASNGVVLVTTKKGKAGRTNIQVNTYYGLTSPLKYIPVMNTAEFYQARYEGLLNQNSTNPTYTTAMARAAALGELGLPSTFPLDSLQYLPSYDWQRDAAFRTGNVKNIELSVNGGSQTSTYFLSGSYNVMEAIIRPVDFSRGTLNAKMTHNLNRKVGLDFGVNLSTIYQSGPYSGGGGSTTAFGSPAYGGALMVPINPITNPDGTYFGLPGSGQTFRGVFNQNLLATSELDDRWQRTNQAVGNLGFNWEIISGLRYRAVVGLDYRMIQNLYYGDPRNSDWFNRKGYIFQENQFNTNFITSHTLNYMRSLGNHNINLLAGTEYRSDENEGSSADAEGFASHEFRTMNSASTPLSVGGFWSGYKMFSVFGRAVYDYEKKYLLTLTIRRDGSSRFGEDKFFGVFPSISAGWNVISEDFMDGSVFSDLKIRASYGHTGNDRLGNFASRALYGSSRVYAGGSALTPSQLGNPDLSWETRKETNVGADIGFMKNKIMLTVDLYKRINDDLLLSRPLAPSSGWGSVNQNLGAMENKGAEFNLMTVLIDKAFKWRTTFNISFQKNEVKDLYDTLKVLPGDASIRVGEALGTIFTQRYAGVNPATGRPMWYDINGNLTYNPSTADRVVIGSTNPTKYGGFTSTMSFHGFEIDAFFNYEYGRTNFDGQYLRLLEIGSRISNGMQPDFERRWQKPGDITDMPRLINGASEPRGAAWTSGSRTYMKQDYIRLKQVTFSYNVPKTVTDRIKVRSTKFYIQGMNLWTYADWPGYDPEFTGDSRGLTPQAKNITVGVTVGL